MCYFLCCTDTYVCLSKVLHKTLISFISVTNLYKNRFYPRADGLYKLWFMSHFRDKNEFYIFNLRCTTCEVRRTCNMWRLTLPDSVNTKNLKMIWFFSVWKSYLWSLFQTPRNNPKWLFLRVLKQIRDYL